MAILSEKNDDFNKIFEKIVIYYYDVNIDTLYLPKKVKIDIGDLHIDDSEKYRKYCSLKEFYELRFITQIVKDKKFTVKDLCKDKSLAEIISNWVECGEIDDQQQDSMQRYDKMRLNSILENFLGSCYMKDLQKKNAYKFSVEAMLGFNKLLNSYTHMYYRWIRQGKIEKVPTYFISAVYQVFSEWAAYGECPISYSEIMKLYEHMYFSSHMQIMNKWKKLETSVKQYINYGKEYKIEGFDYVVNEIIVEELNRCEQRISERCNEKLGDKVRVHVIDFK